MVSSGKSIIIKAGVKPPFKILDPKCQRKEVKTKISQYI